MTNPFAYLILAAAWQGVAISNSPAPPTVILPPHSVPPAAIEPPTSVLRGPQETAPASHYLSDYPPQALMIGAQGTVRFILTIDPTGRVIGCAVTLSSGFPILDAETCRAMQRRARFIPARDRNGNPVAGTIDQQVVWKMH